MNRPKHHRIWNFNAGPSTLPVDVLEEVREEWLNYQGTGMSAMELSHRSPEYDAIHSRALTDAAELLDLGEDHQVLLLQGGASGQFAQIPLNLLKPGDSADYVITGRWSQKALKEAEILATARVAASSEDASFTRIPDPSDWDRDQDAVYTHITSNNTIAGTQYRDFPTDGSPLVADMSSDILSRRIDPAPFGLLYAGAQKNLGPAGVTLVAIRNDLLERCRTDIPIIHRYTTHAEKDSLYNTPPTLAIYILGKVLRWMKENGGTEAMEARNREKAELLYGTIDADADFFRCPVEPESRSWMNVVFRLPSEDLEKAFIEEGKAQGLGGLKGHRSVGGIRVSMYNAMPLEGVRAVVEFMKEFQRTRG